jgi:hypothetical protein
MKLERERDRDRERDKHNPFILHQNTVRPPHPKEQPPTTTTQQATPSPPPLDAVFHALDLDREHPAVLQPRHPHQHKLPLRLPAPLPGKVAQGLEPRHDGVQLLVLAHPAVGNAPASEQLAGRFVGTVFLVPPGQILYLKELTNHLQLEFDTWKSTFALLDLTQATLVLLPLLCHEGGEGERRHGGGEGEVVGLFCRGGLVGLLFAGAQAAVVLAALQGEELGGGGGLEIGGALPVDGLFGRRWDLGRHGGREDGGGRVGADVWWATTGRGSLWR